MKCNAAFLLVLSACVWTIACSGNISPDGRLNPAPAELVAIWQGDAIIAQAWVQQKVIRVRFDIHSDGRVDGWIGDAMIREGRLVKNRGTIGRSLNLFTDYMLEGQLDGAMIEAKGIRRPIVQIPFTFKDGILKGTVQASKSKYWKLLEKNLFADFQLSPAPKE